jgi:hypothetical protein
MFLHSLEKLKAIDLNSPIKAMVFTQDRKHLLLLLTTGALVVVMNSTWQVRFKR